MKRLLIAVLSTVTLTWLTSSLPSHAAVASVSLDWSKLTVATFGISGGTAPHATLSAQSTSIIGSASDPEDGAESFSHTLSNWTSSSFQSAHTNHADATVSASSSTFSSSASATSSSLCCGTGASSAVSRAANFSLDGPGSVIFSVPYSYSLTSSTDFSDSTDLHINGSASLTSFVGGASESSSGSSALDWFSFMGPSSASGTLLFGLVSSTGGTGSVNFQLSTNSFNFSGGGVIPEPSLVLELVAGLSALVVMARRRTAPSAAIE